MKDQRRFAPKSVRNESELVAGFVGISSNYRATLFSEYEQIDTLFQAKLFH